jgi:hypothetical protein
LCNRNAQSSVFTRAKRKKERVRERERETEKSLYQNTQGQKEKTDENGEEEMREWEMQR